MKKRKYSVIMLSQEYLSLVFSVKFCEEDIDQILSRRTQVIRHEETGEVKSSIFSKASFTAGAAGKI